MLVYAVVNVARRLLVGVIFFYYFFKILLKNLDWVKLPVANMECKKT